MASPTQLVQFTFAGGIDQAVRDEALDPSNAFTMLRNARQGERGGLEKRLGLLSMTATRMDDTTISAGHRLFGNEKKTCLMDGTYLNEYSPTVDRWISRGRVPEAALSMVGVPGIGDASGSNISDVIVCGDYIVAIGASANGSVATILDAKTGGVVKAAELINASTDTPMLATYGSVVVAFFWRNNSGTIRYQSISLASVATINTGWSSVANAATDGHPTYTHLGMSVCSLSDRVALAYVNNHIATTNRVNVLTMTPGTIIDTATITTTSVTVNHVAIAPDGAGGLLLAWDESTDVKVYAMSDTLTAVGTAANVITGWSGSGSATHHALDLVGSGTSGCGKLFANRDTDSTGDELDMREFVTSGGSILPAGSTRSIYNARRIGRAFRYGTKYYALCCGYERTSLESVVCDLSEESQYIRPIANIRPALGAGKPWSQVAVYGTTVFVPIITRTSGSARSAELAALDFASTQRSQPARFGNSVFISGSVVAEYDGHQVFESAFVVHPPKPTGVDAGVAGNPNGSYRYALVYEHVDANGNWHQSGVSLPSGSISVSSKKVTLTVRGLSITGRSFPYAATSTDPGIRVSIYRTVAGGEPPYYYVGDVANPIGASTATYTDDAADTTIAANAKLYAPSLPGVNGSSQDHRAPPGLTHLRAGNGVLLGAIDEDLWHSSQDVSGEGAWWSPIFGAPVSGDGKITAIAYQDGTFYVFKRRAVYAITCEPPSDNGAAGGLGTPRKLAADVGCVDNRGLCVTSLGIFFQSERGIELLTRAQSVEWVGEQIKDSLATATVVSATLDAAKSVVYFELSTPSALVYDISRRIWQSVDSRTNTGAGGAIVWDEAQSAYRYACLTTGGAVRVEKATSHLDETSTWIPMSASTGWVKLGGIQGQQIFNRVLLLAKQVSPADIDVTLAYDYGDEQDPTTYAAATLNTLSNALRRVQIQHNAHDEGEGQSVRVTLTDATPTGFEGDDSDQVGTGQGATWVALTFEGQPRPNAALVSEEAA